MRAINVGVKQANCECLDFPRRCQRLQIFFESCLIQRTDDAAVRGHALIGFYRKFERRHQWRFYIAHPTAETTRTKRTRDL